MKLNAVPICKLEKDVAKAELELTEPLLDILRSQRCCLWCRVVDKPDSPELVVWLHDILKPARFAGFLDGNIANPFTVQQSMRLVSIYSF